MPGRRIATFDKAKIGMNIPHLSLLGSCRVDPQSEKRRLNQMHLLSLLFALLAMGAAEAQSPALNSKPDNQGQAWTREVCEEKLLKLGADVASSLDRFERWKSETDVLRRARGMCAEMRVMKEKADISIAVAKACGPAKTPGLSMIGLQAARDNAAKNVRRCKKL